MGGGIVQIDMDIGVGYGVNSIPSKVQSVRLVLCISSPHPEIVGNLLKSNCLSLSIILIGGLAILRILVGQKPQP